jgi:glyoxylase I family protein
MDLASEFAPHHVTISARKLDESIAFYAIFGFRLGLQWEDADGSFKIAHLVHSHGYLLEIFWYAKNERLPPLELDIGNDLEAVGVKHFAFKVRSILDVHRKLSTRDNCGITEIQHGRTGIDFFFVRDPNGIWIEIVQDYRLLDPAHPTRL